MNSKPPEKLRHFRIQSPRDHLQGNDPDFPLPLLNVGDVCAAHVQTDGHIGLSPPLALAQIPDPLAEFHQSSILFAGHPSIVSVISDIMCLT